MYCFYVELYAVNANLRQHTSITKQDNKVASHTTIQTQKIEAVGLYAHLSSKRL